MKNYTFKLFGLTALLLTLSFHAILGQTNATFEQYQMRYDNSTLGEGEFIQNLKHSFDLYGIGFYTGQELRMAIVDDGILMYTPIIAAEILELEADNINVSDLQITGTMSSFSMIEDGDIYDLDILRGTNDLRFEGSPTSGGTNMIITETGKVGIGYNTPTSQLHVAGADNDGSVAALAIGSPGQLMLLDGNEIDATASILYFQNNSEYNIEALNGGGNFGIGIPAPSEKLHINGNLRIDNGDIMAHGGFQFKPDIDQSGDDQIVFYNNVDEETFRIHTDGNVGIGVDAPTEKLEVDGTVKATSFVTSTASFPDYVFEKSYTKLSLGALKSYVSTNKHLPNMPSEAEVIEEGLDVGDVVVKSVENIETIYLHLIEMNERLDQLQQENAALKAQLSK